MDVQAGLDFGPCAQGALRRLPRGMRRREQRQSYNRYTDFPRWANAGCICGVGCSLVEFGDASGC
jgi:hypothetical protein